MKGPSTDQTVYNCMFPHPKSTDPQNFQGLLQRHLVPEVRLETQAFYGHLASQEAKYPGLDYSHQPHRIRLSRYPWHRRLFRAFDSLGLTKHEIAGLTKWEGTRWAKERFEREQGIYIRDTTADCIGEWVPPELRLRVAQQTTEPVDAETADDDGVRTEYDGEVEPENDLGDAVELEENDLEDSDSEMQSVGVELNERLLTAAAQREAGDSTVTFDEAWEKWLHEHSASIESFTPDSPRQLTPLPDLQNLLSPDVSIPGTRPAASNDSRAMFSQWIDQARAGQWNEIPYFMHSFIRQEIRASSRRENASTSSPTSYSTSSPTSPSPLSANVTIPNTSARQPTVLASARSIPRSESTEYASQDRGSASLNMRSNDLPTPPPEIEVSSSITLSRLRSTHAMTESYPRRHVISSAAPNLRPGNRTLNYARLAARREPRFSS